MTFLASELWSELGGSSPTYIWNMMYRICKMTFLAAELQHWARTRSPPIGSILYIKSSALVSCKKSGNTSSCVDFLPGLSRAEESWIRSLSPSLLTYSHLCKQGPYVWENGGGWGVINPISHILLHCKKRLAVFPFPAGMSLIKSSLAGNYKIFPAMASLVSDIYDCRDGKIANLFYSVIGSAYTVKNKVLGLILRGT